MLRIFSAIVYAIRFRKRQDTIIPLGALHAGGSMAVVYHKTIWDDLSLKQKTSAVFSNVWPPKDYDYSNMAKETYLEEIFGGNSIISELLFDIARQREATITEYTNLTPLDLEKAQGLNSTAHLLFRKYKFVDSNPKFYIEFDDDIDLQELLINISSKFPIYNVKYFLHVNVFFAFDEIRRLNVPKADDIINSLYDLLYSQQKISSSLFESVHKMSKINKARSKDKTNVLNYEQIELGKELESLIVMQKSTIEKIIALLSVVYHEELSNSKRGSDSKVKRLEDTIPDFLKSSEYFKFLFKHLNRDGYKDLEELRTKILHWVGEERLQPHSYMKRTSEENYHLNLELYSDVIRFHYLNTLGLISCLAMLTDKFMLLESPEMLNARRKETIELMVNSIRFDRLKLKLAEDEQNKIVDSDIKSEEEVD